MKLMLPKKTIKLITVTTETMLQCIKEQMIMEDMSSFSWQGIATFTACVCYSSILEMWVLLKCLKTVL
jgi:hypothetical protein